MITETGVTMIGGRSGNETIPTLNVNNNYAPTLVHHLNLELDLQAIPYHQPHKVNDPQ